MAKLSSDSLTLEISFRNLEFGWVQYDVLFLRNDKNLINEKTLKCDSPHWRDRVHNAFRVNEFDKDTLIPVIETFLETNEPDYWEPTEPDIILGFYPDWSFPFVNEFKKIKAGEELSNTIYDKDVFTIVAFIDQYNFEGADCYTGDGVALVISCERKVLTDFLNELKKEYSAFCLKYDG